MRDEQVQNAMFLAAFLLLIGLPPLIAGVVMLVRRFGALWRGALVEAEIVRWEMRRLPAAVKRAPTSLGERRASTAIPHFRHVDAEGRPHLAVLDRQLHRGEWQRYPVGARMPVRIDPARPHIAFAADAASMWVFPGLLVFAGLLATLLGLGVFYGS
ncbi:MAG: DUF3592 domain-containing protein [Methylobacteriaceae bacterium]|nr:DUF3592 domain-containing protein [Methylobacteriaceae bacterium]